MCIELDKFVIEVTKFQKQEFITINIKSPALGRIILPPKQKLTSWQP